MRQWSTQAKIDIPIDVATDPVISHGLVKSHIKTLVRKASRERATASIQDYFHTLLTLESTLLADYLLQDLADSIVDSEDMIETVRRSQELFGELEINLENSLIDAYQNMHDKAHIFIDQDSLAYNYLVRYRQLAKMETEFSALQPHDKVAFVGAGAFPISAMEFAKLTGCRVVGLDILEDAVAVAKNAVTDFGLQRKLKILQAAGQNFDYSGYTVVFVGVLAEPKPEIMRQIRATADPSVRVFCRTTHGLRKMIYRPTREHSLRPYHAVHAHAAEGFQTLSTLALAAPGV